MGGDHDVVEEAEARVFAAWHAHQGWVSGGRVQTGLILGRQIMPRSGPPISANKARGHVSHT